MRWRRILCWQALWQESDATATTSIADGCPDWPFLCEGRQAASPASSLSKGLHPKQPSAAEGLPFDVFLGQLETGNLHKPGVMRCKPRLHSLSLPTLGQDQIPKFYALLWTGCRPHCVEQPGSWPGEAAKAGCQEISKMMCTQTGNKHLLSYVPWEAPAHDTSSEGRWPPCRASLTEQQGVGPAFLAAGVCSSTWGWADGMPSSLSRETTAENYRKRLRLSWQSVSYAKTCGPLDIVSAPRPIQTANFARIRFGLARRVQGP